MQRVTIKSSPSTYPDQSAKPLPSPTTSTTPPLPVSPEKTQRQPDRPPSWLGRPYEPAAEEGTRPPLRNAKSTSALGTGASQETGGPNPGVTWPAAPTEGSALRKSASKPSLRNVTSLKDIKNVMSSFRKAKPSASAGASASAGKSPDDVIPKETGLTGRAAVANADLEAQKILAQQQMEAGEQEVHEKFLQLTQPERDLRTDLVKNEKMEEMIDQAIEQNDKAIARDKTTKGKFSGALSGAERTKQEEHKRLEGFSRDQWREKVLAEKGEPTVTEKDIIALMMDRGIQTKLFNFAVSTGRAQPAGVFKKELEKLDDQFAQLQLDQAEFKAKKKEKEKKMLDPLSVSDSSDEEAEVAAAFEQRLKKLNIDYRRVKDAELEQTRLKNPGNSDNDKIAGASLYSFNSLQGEAATSEITIDSRQAEAGSMSDSSR